jgi:predicted  nucleic acid-binding Zn-ribbon protein
LTGLKEKEGHTTKELQASKNEAQLKQRQLNDVMTKLKSLENSKPKLEQHISKLRGEIESMEVEHVSLTCVSSILYLYF